MILAIADGLSQLGIALPSTCASTSHTNGEANALRINDMFRENSLYGLVERKTMLYVVTKFNRPSQPCTSKLYEKGARLHCISSMLELRRLASTLVTPIRR